MHVTTGKAFDDRRNSSRVILPPPDALANARRALAAVPPGVRDWIAKRQRGEHDHDARRADGSRASCPVWSCRK